MISIDEGMQIDQSMKQHWNARDGIHRSFEPVSSLITERHMHDLKQASPRLSTDDGMQTD
jgi:hypothetical protein